MITGLITASYSNNQKVEDPDKLINHAPVLKSAELKKHSDGSPYLNIRADKAHEDTQLLNNISNGWVKADVWLRVNNGEWKSCHSDSFVEEFNIGAEAYFGLKVSYDEAVYEIKFRYSFNNDNYPAAGKSGVIYSPFSNIISHGMAAYSNASNWAKTELDKAAEYDLIPQSLKGTDMTKPITGEEFAELAVKLWALYCLSQPPVNLYIKLLFHTLFEAIIKLDGLISSPLRHIQLKQLQAYVFVVWLRSQGTSQDFFGLPQFSALYIG